MNYSAQQNGFKYWKIYLLHVRNLNEDVLFYEYPKSRFLALANAWSIFCFWHFQVINLTREIKFRVKKVVHSAKMTWKTNKL